MLWGCAQKDSRMLRGGSFNNNPQNVRCAYRNNNNPDNRNNNNGFRVIVSTFLSKLPARIVLRLVAGFKAEVQRNGGAQPWPSRFVRPGK